MATAQQISDFYRRTAHLDTEAMVLVGDFNCQPGDRPFRQQSPNQLQAVRERAVVLRDRNRLAYFYNPLWRWLGEPDDFETTQRRGYQPSRLLGTHLPLAKKTGWTVWDQLMVTKPLIIGSQIHLRESSLRVNLAHAKCSDHCVIGAVFEC